MKTSSKRHILTVIAISVLATIALLIWRIAPAVAEATTWEETKKQWEAKGESFDIEDFYPEPVPDELNAAAHPWVVERTDEYGVSTDFGKDLNGNLSEEFFIEFIRGVVGTSALPTQTDAQQFLRGTTSAPHFSAIKEVSLRPHWRSHSLPQPYDYSLTQGFPDVELCKLWCARSTSHLILDSPLQAWEELKTAQNVHRWTDGGAAIIDLLVNCRGRQLLADAYKFGIQKDQWSDQQLKEVAQFDSWEHSSERFVLRALRATVASSLAIQDYGLGAPQPRAVQFYGDSQKQLTTRLILEPIERHERGDGSSTLVDLATDLKTTYESQFSLLGSEFANFFAESAATGLDTFVQNTCIVLTQSRLTRVAAALALHHRQHGSYPESLDDLVPEILPTSPTDPMINGALGYRVEEDGSVTVWSTGVDQTDNDGGNDDIVVTLPARK